MNQTHNDLSPPSPAFQPYGHAPCLEAPAIHGETACMHAFERLRALAPRFWTALPVCAGEPADGFAAVLKAALGGSAATFPYAAIVAEAERTLEHGIRESSPLALLLLAALALEHGADGAGARTLAQAALEMAARLGGRALPCARTLHAALVAPFTASLGQSAIDLSALCEDETALSCAHAYLAANGLMAGISLPALSHRVGRAHRLPAADPHAAALAAELTVRAGLFHGLLQRQAAPAPHGAGTGTEIRQEPRFGHWVSHLQVAFHAGDHATARHAAERAQALAGPLLPVGDRLACHLFAILALVQSDEAGAAARLELHGASLRRLAARLPADAGALLRCADAARAAHAGDRLGALGGFDAAGAEASRQGRHWLAVLAWEQAALTARACGLASAAQHYLRQALAACEEWGAAGRAAMLRDAWGEAAAGQQDDREHMQRAGGVGELGLSIAHEVNQPLAAISLHAAAARRWLSRERPDIERALSSLALIGAAGQHAGDIVRSVQRLALREQEDMDSVPVDQTITDTLRLLHRPLRKHGIEIELALGLGDCTIHASRVQLQQVLTNLLVNATEALAGTSRGAAARRICVRSRRSGEHDIEIAVADNGPGIAPEHAGRVFGSLFSTKSNSTGMGLSISLAIIRAHGGHIEYEACEPHGACFRFRLPVQSSRP
jgi:signal transduction histidine kinase